MLNNRLCLVGNPVYPGRRKPPSTTMFAPVMYLPASEQSNNAAPAASAGSA